MREVAGFNYVAKMNPYAWPYPCPRPFFKTSWRYRLTQVKSVAGIGMQVWMRAWWSWQTHQRPGKRFSGCRTLNVSVIPAPGILGGSSVGRPSGKTTCGWNQYDHDGHGGENPRQWTLENWFSVSTQALSSRSAPYGCSLVWILNMYLLEMLAYTVTGEW